MTTPINDRKDGIIGLSVLALMTVAFVASEARSGLPWIERLETDSRATLPPPVLIDLGPPTSESGIGGAIRELRVLPITIDSRLDLHWSPDDTVIEEYRRSRY